MLNQDLETGKKRNLYMERLAYAGLSPDTYIFSGKHVLLLCLKSQQNLMHLNTGF